MRISPIGINYPSRTKFPISPKHKAVEFKGKHDAAKAMGGIFGALGTLGAIGGTVIMTGGVALPFVIAYGALSAGSGAVIGHLIDKGNPDYNKKK